jgi:glutathione S-transferase
MIVYSVSLFDAEQDPVSDRIDVCRLLQCNAALYPIFTATGDAQRKAVQEAQQCLKTLETALDGKKFFGGDAVGYLDIVVGWYAHWLPVVEEVIGASVVTDEELPLMKAWFDRFLAVDVVKAALPDRDRLLAANKARREQLLSA